MEVIDSSVDWAFLYRDHHTRSARFKRKYQCQFPTFQIYITCLRHRLAVESLTRSSLVISNQGFYMLDTECRQEYTCEC